MDELQQAKTVAVKACAACGSGILAHDKFCRWCGATQPRPEALGVSHVLKAPTATAACNTLGCATVSLADCTRPEVFRRISGPLVNAVASGALVGPATSNESAIVRRVVLALISIPIWLIIVLLSPLDAYAAVKNITRQV